jgi:hypothetical protein
MLESSEIGSVLLGPPIFIDGLQIEPFVEEKANINVTFWLVIASNAAAEKVDGWNVRCWLQPVRQDVSESGQVWVHCDLGCAAPLHLN